jgi:hypothetical protein
MTCCHKAMRLLLVLCLLPAWAFGASIDRLTQLKREFPGHPAGEVTNKSNPAVIQCWRKYHDRVGALTMDNLPQQIQRLKDDAAQELSEIEYRLEDPKNRIKASTRAAEGQNRDFIKLRFIPYLKRIEQFQRGR